MPTILIDRNGMLAWNLFWPQSCEMILDQTNRAARSAMQAGTGAARRARRARRASEEIGFSEIVVSLA